MFIRWPKLAVWSQIAALMTLLLTAIPVVAGSSVEYGPPTALGNGSLRSFVKLKGNGRPKTIGVEFGGAALTGLPSGEPSDGTWDIPNPDGTIAWHCCGYEHLVTLPPSTAATPFDHIVVNWNNEGHPPPGVYNPPHFDFHFYIISNAERQTIAAPATASEMCVPTPGVPPVPLTCDILARALTPLPAAQMPPNFFSPGAVEPGMGNHLLDRSTAELNGGTFTQTWIYGTWDGAISFFEPMITLAYLQGLQGKICYDLKMPLVFAEAGDYPTRYCTAYNKNRDTYRITLEKFERFAGE